ncbi:hypothetical protein [Bacteroides sp. AF32-8BH]|uniref:hypothetical protein n=1 Tax=Bacteroides sp. AF32-8BH TaxID=2302925 RepID=UPI000E416559|nr:hypothetical protein [Bacteroides sp. AF32-8BH]RGE77120.1 hypothetical protein DWZ47_18980 [Bacteroides sp. AF32-8BH]
MKEINKDSSKIKFIQGLSTEDYSLYYTYNRIDEVQEVIRGHYGLPSKDTPKAIKVSSIDGILFITKNSGILADYICKENDGKFELYEMNLKTYNEYERYMSDLMVA